MDEGLGKLDCSVDTNPSLQLYRALTESLNKIGRDTLTNSHLFCPLPSHSYHVTVWDGLNDGNAKNLSYQYRPDAEEFLTKADIDFVVIVTTNDVHEKFTVLALEKGKNVIVEKPMSMTYESTQRMIQAAEKTGKC